MSPIDMEELLEPCEGESPCGGDLDDSFVFMGLEDQEFRWSDSQPRPEEEETDWSEVRSECVDLLGEAKNLQVAFWLTLACMHRDGIEGLREGLALMRRMLERYWDDLYPKLDPDLDDYPGQRRQGVVEKLKHPVLFLTRFWQIPLCAERPADQFTWRDCLIAQGELEVPEGVEDVPDLGSIRGELQETDASAVEEALRAAEAVLEDAAGIREVFAERADERAVPEIQKFESAVSDYAEFLSEHGGVARAGAEAEEDEEGESEAGAAAAGSRRGASGRPGEIRSQQDVLDALDRICLYYKEHNPSSPVPLLLHRAKRLVGKDFREVVEELIPNALGEIDSLSGVDREEQSP